MSTNSSIEWTEATWNPVTGCTKISPGCRHCYAERMARRLQAMGQANYRHGFQVTLQETAVNLPLNWKKPRKIFANSMSDLFHREVPADFIQKIFQVMQQANWHRYQILTKRSSRLQQLDPELNWQSHIWMGVTVESEKYLGRIEDLLATRAHLKFISFEPLLGPIPRIDLTGIDWVIAGGESGPHSRSVKIEWLRGLRDNCLRQNIPFFFKQWGGFNKKRNGRYLDNIIWDQMPEKSVAKGDFCAIPLGAPGAV